MAPSASMLPASPLRTTMFSPLSVTLGASLVDPATVVHSLVPLVGGAAAVFSCWGAAALACLGVAEALRSQAQEQRIAGEAATTRASIWRKVMWMVLLGRGLG